MLSAAPRDGVKLPRVGPLEPVVMVAAEVEVALAMVIVLRVSAVTLGAVFHLPMEIVSTDKTALPA